MKIAVSATGNRLESIMDQRFGRTAFFLIVDLETMQLEVIDNSAASSGGAGIIAAQTMVDKGVQVVITGNVGPNAMNVLSIADIPVYQGRMVSIRQNIEEYKKGALEKIDTAVSSHFGMGTVDPK